LLERARHPTAGATSRKRESGAPRLSEFVPDDFVLS
jgi:hypothetical protein